MTLSSMFSTENTIIAKTCNEGWTQFSDFELIECSNCDISTGVIVTLAWIALILLSVLVTVCAHYLSRIAISHELSKEKYTKVRAFFSK